MSSRVRYALDQGFPCPKEIIGFVRASSPTVELAYLHEIHEGLGDLEDWQLLIALDLRGWRGLITTDARMLTLPREMATLHRLRMSLVVARGTQNDPVAAIGLVLLHIRAIARQDTPTKSQIWDLSAQTREAGDAWQRMHSIAKHRGTDPKDINKDFGPSKVVLARDPPGELGA